MPHILPTQPPLTRKRGNPRLPTFGPLRRSKRLRSRSSNDGRDKEVSVGSIPKICKGDDNTVEGNQVIEVENPPVFKQVNVARPATAVIDISPTVEDSLVPDILSLAQELAENVLFDQGVPELLGIDENKKQLLKLGYHPNSRSVNKAQKSILSVLSAIFSKMFVNF